MHMYMCIYIYRERERALTYEKKLRAIMMGFGSQLYRFRVCTESVEDWYTVGVLSTSSCVEVVAIR